MIIMDDAEFAARLQHSSNIDELMEGLNDRPARAQKTAAQAQSINAPLAPINEAKASLLSPADQRDRLILMPRPSYNWAA